MSLIVLIGAQAVGKMTVGRELEKKIDGRLLYNHQTIDIFANFLGYTNKTFSLSTEMRIALFKEFVANKETNVTDSIIFTVLIDFDNEEDIQFLKDITAIFNAANESVYFIELVADLEERLERNIHEERLLAKPSKRNIEFSRNELLNSNERYRLESTAGEVEALFPEIHYLKINNTKLSVVEVTDIIVEHFDW